MKKLYTKPEIDLVDLTVKESLMYTDHGYPVPGGSDGLRDDYWMDATSRNGFDKYDDIIWD